MTTWTDATESPEYVVPGYVAMDYVRITWDIDDGSGTSWSNASEPGPSWASAE